VRTVTVQPTTDTELVSNLLSRWKSDTRSFVRSNRMTHLVAWIEEQPVGVLVGTHDFANWDILDQYQHLTEYDRGSYVAAMFVDPRSRAQGVGGELLDAFVAEAEARRSPVVIAWPDEDEEGRDGRVRFFRSHGFDFLDYPGRNREPWLMGRALA
jgi:GNAT superfamily N-acetyltransferase